MLTGMKDLSPGKAVATLPWTLALVTLCGLFFIDGLSAQGGGCGHVAYTLQDYEPCRYRLHVNNTSECYTALRILLDAGEFVDGTASAQTGWSATLTSPTELSLTHVSGIIPLGESTPVTFRLPPNVSPVLTVLWDYFCPLGEGCFAEIPIMACSDPGDASITGVKYRECGGNTYINQPVLLAWPVDLVDGNGNVIAGQQTGADGSYAFYDLPAGQYIVREATQDGWTANIPANGQVAVSLNPSEHVVQNFGNCPTCSCDSIYLDVSQQEGSSDTSTHDLTIANSQPYCFSFITVKVDSGQLISQELLLPGWTVALQGPNLLRLNPPGPLLPGEVTVPLRFRIGGAGTHQVVVTAYWNNGLGNVACPRLFGFPGPLIKLPCACPGAIPGLNLLDNGNFSAGPFGFSSGLSFSGSCGSGSYGVQTNFNGFCPGWPSLLDHTSNTPPASRKFLIIDGESFGTQPTVLWESQVLLAPNTNYCFSFWWASVRPTSQQSFPISIDIVNSLTNLPIANLGTQTIAQTPAATWQQSSFVWNSGNIAGSRHIALRQLTSGPERDFGIDDICMRETEGCTADFSFQTNCLNAQFTNLSQPASGLTYSWNFGDNQTSTQPNPSHPYTTCGTYNVCLNISGPGCTKQICKSVTITDNVPPVAVCVPAFGVTLNANCTYAVTAAAIDGGSTDNCQIVSKVVTPTTLNGCGFFPVTLKVTDQCNNMSSCTTTVQTTEVVPPVINCPPGFQQECNGNLPPSLTGTATATDNCTATSQIVITYTDLLSGTPGCDDFVRRTWKAVDACGNSATCQQIISVHDDVPPVITSCPAPITVAGTINAQGNCVAAVNMGTPTATDNCSPGVTFTNSFNGTANASGTYPGGTTTVVWTGTDGCGNTTTCSVIVMVVNCACTADFTFRTLDDCGRFEFTNQATGPGALTSVWNFGDPASGPFNTSTLFGPIHEFSTCGTYNVCLTVSGAGCSNTFCQMITITDQTPPVAICQAEPLSLDANCQLQLTPALVDGGSTDNCQIKTMSVNPTLLTGCGTFPVTLTVTDWCGNTSTCSLNVQTVDVTRPVIVCPPSVTVNALPPECLIKVNGIAPLSVSDECGIAKVEYEISPFGSGLNDASGWAFGQGFSNVMYTATDNCGNVGTCDFLVIVTCKPEACSCPEGGLSGANLVVNGDFSSGNAGFSSDLPPVMACTFDSYWVGNNFTTKCSVWPSLPDHTSGTGNFLIVDGNPTTPKAVWQQPVNVVVGKTYCVSFWVASLYDTPFDLLMTVSDNNGNSSVVGMPQINQVSPLWTNYTYTWTCPATLTGSIKTVTIREVTGGEQRDFGLDDICFRDVSCGASFTFQDDGCGLFSFTSQATGSGQLTYFWSFGDGISSAPNPTHQYGHNGGPQVVTLQVTDGAGCQAVFSALVPVPVLPNVAITGHLSICAGECTTLTATGNGILTCQWSTSENTQSIQVCPLVTSTYSVTCTDANGCTDDYSVTVQVTTCGCPGSLVKNGSFSFGIQPGQLGLNGTASFWKPIFTPDVSIADGCGQAGCVQLWGNQIVGEGIEQPIPIQPGCTYQIDYCAKYMPFTAASLNPQLRFRATTVPGVVDHNPPLYGVLAPNAVLMGNSPTLTLNWTSYSFNWTAPLGPALTNFVVTTWNNSTVQDPAMTSWARIDSICVQKLSCPVADCGPFTQVGFGYEHGPFVAADCGNTSPVVVPCPEPDEEFHFTGHFTCSGVTTAGVPVVWSLWQNGLPTGVTGTVTATPFFGIPLASTYFTAGGVYELRLEGRCGDKICPCVIKFDIPPCPDPCSCDDLAADVAEGFYQTLWSQSCKRCFTPTGLADCDRIEWSLEPTDTSYVNPVGVSAGNQPFCFSFATGGTYTVTIHVIRQRPDGTVCEATFYKKVFVTCAGTPDCENEVLLNPQFGNGHVAGTLGVNGQSDDWLRVTGSPAVVDSSQTGDDGWAILLAGNDNTYDAIRTDQAYCLEKDTGTITLSARCCCCHGNNTIPPLHSAMIFVNLVRDDNYATASCEDEQCYEVACLTMPEHTGEWVTFQFDYDLRDLPGFDNCGLSGSAVRVRPVLYVGNWFHDAQGGEATYSEILMDNFCLQGAGVVPVSNPLMPSTFRIFPNPNPGVFNVELSAPAQPRLIFRIVGLTGQRLREQPTEAGVPLQTVRVSDLPPGLYFLQVVAEGRIVAVEKFVKDQ